MDASPGYVILIMESGSDWPAWIDRCRSSATHVIGQADGAPPQQLADRATERAEAAIRVKASIEAVVIACNERIDAGAVDARRAAANAMLRAMARAGRGELLFSVSRRSSGRARHALCALASELSQVWEKSGVSVGVRFGADAPAPAELEKSVA